MNHCSYCGAAIPSNAVYCETHRRSRTRNNIGRIIAQNAAWFASPQRLWTRRIMHQALPLDETQVWVENGKRIIYHRDSRDTYYVIVNGFVRRYKGKQARGQALEFVLQELGIEKAA